MTFFRRPKIYKLLRNVRASYTQISGQYLPLVGGIKKDTVGEEYKIINNAIFNEWLFF